MKLASMALAVSAMTLCGTASAVTFTYNGATTASGPTFNRPLAGTPPTSLSSVGTAVHYATLTFGVSVSGSYSFLESSTYDNFSILYLGSFLPGSPLTNALVANDDLSGIGNSGFTINLTTGSTYVFVATSFSNADVGAFTETITGPGNVVVAGAVPEPSTYALMALGLAGIGVFARRRQGRAADSAA